VLRSVFCHWGIVTGASKFILPSPSGSSTQRRMLVPVQGIEVLLIPRRNVGRLSERVSLEFALLCLHHCTVENNAIHAHPHINSMLTFTQPHIINLF
jgi:hypothetical protein